MKRYLIKIPVLIIFTAFFLIVKEQPKAEFDFGSYDLAGAFRDLIPEASTVEKKNYLSSWSDIYDTKGNVTGKYILSSPFCDDVKGYGGNFILAIIGDKEEKIIGLSILKHRETPSWISGLDNIKFFDSWNGKKLNEINSMHVDAVSGATYTTRAVKNIINRRAGIFAGINNFVNTSGISKINFTDSKYDLILYFIIFISLIAIFIKKLNKFRIYIQLASIISFGFISGKFISLYFLESLSVNGIEILTSWVTIILLIFSIGVPLILNKHFYCYYICPFGGVQTLLGKIPVRKFRAGTHVIKFFRLLRLIIFLTLLISIASSLKINLTLAEPFTVFLFSSASTITITGSAVIFVASIFIRNPWCVYFCPTGQFFDLLKDGSPVKALR